MSLVSTKQAGLAGFTKYRSLADASGNPAFNIPGMVLMTDYTITHAGTSATLTNGQVTFTGVTSLSLNGVFSADFDNYLILIRCLGNTDINMQLRMVASGTPATGSNYTTQEIYAVGTVVGAGRASGTIASFQFFGSQNMNGTHLHLYGPALAQPTAFRAVGARGTGGAQIDELAGTHSLSTSYDGLYISATNGNITGALQVYGVRS